MSVYQNYIFAYQFIKAIYLYISLSSTEFCYLNIFLKVACWLAGQTHRNRGHDPVCRPLP